MHPLAEYIGKEGMRALHIPVKGFYRFYRVNNSLNP